MYFASVDILFVPSSCNSYANELAKLGLSTDLDHLHVWIDPLLDFDWSPSRLCNRFSGPRCCWVIHWWKKIAEFAVKKKIQSPSHLIPNRCMFLPCRMNKHHISSHTIIHDNYFCYSFFKCRHGIYFGQTLSVWLLEKWERPLKRDEGVIHYKKYTVFWHLICHNTWKICHRSLFVTPSSQKFTISKVERLKWLLLVFMCLWHIFMILILVSHRFMTLMTLGFISWVLAPCHVSKCHVRFKEKHHKIKFSLFKPM